MRPVAILALLTFGTLLLIVVVLFLSAGDPAPSTNPPLDSQRQLASDNASVDKRTQEKLLQDLPAIARAASANNAFAWSLWAKLQPDTPQNIVFSPYSLSQALSLAATGTTGNTANELWAGLGFPTGTTGTKDQQSLTAAVASAKSPNVTFTNANALWATNAYPLKPGFVTQAQSLFSASAQTVDFTQAGPTATRINQWVQDNTGGKIKNLISPGNLSSDMRLALTNAIYFKGDWDRPFKPENTRPEPFNPTNAPPVTVPMLKDHAWMMFAQDDAYEMLELPYVDRRIIFRTILPRSDVQGPIPPLDAARVDALKKAATDGPVEITLPKLKLDWKLDVNRQLQSLGIRQAFSEGDFSPMFISPPAQGTLVSAVIHAATLDLDEKGTVAAAATFIGFAAAAAPDPNHQPPKVRIFKADHPFVFQIVDTKTNTILFMGQVNDPSK